MGTEWFRIEADTVLTDLKTDVKHGLSREDAAERLKKYGKNMLTTEHSLTAFKILREQLQDSTVFILFWPRQFQF